MVWSWGACTRWSPLGYTMVYGIINLINFAHGEVLMIGALTSWTIVGLIQESMPGLPGWMVLLIAMLVACVVAAVLNFSIEKIAYRPLRNSPRLAPLITAIGMSILLQTLAMIIWKPNYKSYPTLLAAEPFQVAGADHRDPGDGAGRDRHLPVHAALRGTPHHAWAVPCAPPPRTRAWPR